MYGLEDIPMELRWEIATKSASGMPVIYDMLFREAFGDKVDELEMLFWTEGGKNVKDIAASLDLPAENAQEVDNALGTVSIILLGPEFKNEIVKATDERVIERLTACPMLNRIREIGRDPSMVKASEHCQAFCTNAVESLNPRYSLIYTKKMCTGDSCCEYTIELRR
jgi:hypothetical protein